MVIRGFQVGASPGPEPSRETTVALKASLRVVSARGGMQSTPPWWEPESPGCSVAAKDKSTEATSSRRAASQALPGSQVVLRREAAEPAGSGAGIRGPACAGYDAAALAQ